MKTLVTTLAIIAIVVLFVETAGADSPKTSLIASASSDSQPTWVGNQLVRLRVDPTGSVIEVQPPHSRDVIDSSFDFISATCTDCFHVCPPLARSIEVVLQARTGIAAGYGVSELTSLRYSVPAAGGIAYSTQAALSAGQQITVTVTGDVDNCENWFNVYFSMCDIEPASPSTGCQPPALSSCQAIVNAGLSTGDGVYWIDPDGPGGNTQFQVFCDMTTFGGGWTVVFNASQPQWWGTDFGLPGGPEWSHDFTAIPFAMNEVLLNQPATGQSLIVAGIPIGRLYTCSFGSNGLFWDGSAWFGYGALHLGVCSTSPFPGFPGYVTTCGLCNNNRTSWGFGHLHNINNQQGWGWSSTNLGPRIFRIAIR